MERWVIHIVFTHDTVVQIEQGLIYYGLVMVPASLALTLSCSPRSLQQQLLSRTQVMPIQRKKCWHLALRAGIEIVFGE